MLVECPRCHFNQPQDHYCARCGVDMSAYKPKEVPVFTKVVKGGVFQFFMVVFLGFGVTYFVVRTDQPQKWIQRINRFASVSPKTNSQALTEAGLAAPSQDLESPPALVNNWAARGIVSSTSATATTSETVSTSTELSKTASATNSAPRVLRMIEIDNEYLNTLLQQAHAANSVLQDDEIKIFIAPTTTSISSLQVLNTDNIEGNVTVNNYGTPTRSLSLETTFRAAADNVFSFGLRFKKTHPNGPFAFPVEFALRRGEKLVIAGNSILSYFEFETQLANTPPFQIMKSPDYRNQKTTFALILELR